jgi:sugar phosphate isomerase/epimerase
MKISLGSWAFSFGPYADDPVPFERIVHRLSQAGYDGIEISGFPPQVSLDQFSTAQSRSGLARLLGDHGLGVSGYSADFTSVNPCRQENRGRYLDLFRRYIELCAEIGSPMIRVDSGSAPGSLDDRDYQPAFERLASLWQEAAELAASAGLRVAWEVEPGFVFNKASEALAMHRAVNHPAFGILFDTAHAYMCAVVGARQHGVRETLPDGVAGMLALLGDRIGAIHLIDSDGTLYADETSTHRPFGEGRIDFAALVPALLALPGIGWWTVDLSFWPGAWDLVERELAWVRGLLARTVAR